MLILDDEGHDVMGGILAIFLIGLFVLLLWSFFAICAKRLHDIGHSRWWVLIILLSFLSFPLPLLVVVYLGTRNTKLEPVTEG